MNVIKYYRNDEPQYVFFKDRNELMKYILYDKRFEDWRNTKTKKVEIYFDDLPKNCEEEIKHTQFYKTQI